MARNVTIQRVAPSPTTDNSTGGSFSTGVFTPNADNAIADVDAIEAILNGVVIADLLISTITLIDGIIEDYDFERNGTVARSPNTFPEGLIRRAVINN